MRGKTLFKQEFEESTNIDKKKSRVRKSQQLRNECLTDRYYYYGSFTDKRFDAILEQLGVEFFLSTETISDIIQTQTGYISNLKKNKPGIYYFQNKWPHLKWKY